MKTKHIFATVVLVLTMCQIVLPAQMSKMHKAVQSLEKKLQGSMLETRVEDFIAVAERINKSSLDDRRVFNKADGQTTWEMITQEWENGAWQDKYRDIVIYDDLFEEMIEIMTYEWKNGTWVNHNRMSAEIDADGNLTMMLMETWMTNTWIIDMKMTYTFNSDGNLTSTLIQVDENSDSILENMMRTDSIYDSNGFLIEEKSYMHDNGTWIEMQKTVYTNNAQGLPVESVSQMDLGGGEYMDTGKSTFTYDASGNLLVQTQYYPNFLNQGWTESDRTTYTYNGAGQEINILDETWNGAGWTNEQQMTATYDGQGRQTDIVYQVWNGAWVNEERHSHTFGANGQISETLIQTWNGSWQNTTRWLYSYSPVSVNESIQIPQHFSLTTYPNPFNPSTTISFTLPNPNRVTLHIFNSRGELVRTLMQGKNLSNGKHKIFWNGCDMRNQSMPSGVYFIKLSGESFQNTTRALLIK
jgi:hypothetical protein